MKVTYSNMSWGPTSQTVDQNIALLHIALFRMMRRFRNVDYMPIHVLAGMENIYKNAKICLVWCRKKTTTLNNQ